MDLEMDKLIVRAAECYCEKCNNRTSFEILVEKSQKLRVFYLSETDEWENEVDDPETMRVHIFCEGCGTELAPPK